MINRAKQWLRRQLVSKDEATDGSCKKYGHNYKKKKLVGFYTSGVPHFGIGGSFTVKRKDMYECSKCGKAKFEKTKIGKVKVDKHTNELTVKQNSNSIRETEVNDKELIFEDGKRVDPIERHKQND